MRSADYAARRDIFTRALNALREAELEFVESIDFLNGVKSEYDVAERLDEEEKVLTGQEYLQLMSAVRLLETLVGRSHASAVSLEAVGS